MAIKTSLFIITILLLSSFSSMIGQGSNPAFVFLPDMTGYSLEGSPQHLKDELLAAADALRAALPDTVMQNSFAVYDLGFYAHHPNMVGGIPEVMAKAISDRITHSYYLFFGREMDDQGDLKRVWVEVELPNTAEFCFWEDGTFTHLKFMVDFRANAAKGLSMSNPGPIFDAMKNGINYMADRVGQLVECCGSAARQSCDCGWSFGDIRQFTDGRGFYEFEAEVSPSISLDTFCVCFNEFQVSEEEYPLDSGEVIVSTTLDEINFSDSLSISISDLREILLGFGDAANALNLSFFGAITDQNVFCKSEELPLSIRTLSNTNHLEFEEKLASADYGLWFNILHFNGTATVSILARGFDLRIIEFASEESPFNVFFNDIMRYVDVEFTEPKLGQLGNLGQIKDEMLIAFDVSNTKSATIGEKLKAMSLHFAANRFFTRDKESGKLIDREDSRIVARYIYTTERGWIDMHHFFELTNITRRFDKRIAQLYAYNSERYQGIRHPESSFSYEDMASNSVGIEFWLIYANKFRNEEKTLLVAVDECFSNLGAVEPSEAPNYEYIPHIIQGEFVLKSNESQGLKGEYLRKAHKAIWDRRPVEMRKNIEEARCLIEAGEL